MSSEPTDASGQSPKDFNPQYDSSANKTPALTWDGERMFNIYIHDYCFKRGYRKTARELQIEASLDPKVQPPINARQGLLFEWWSVFWVLFQAKSGSAGGVGVDDAVMYNLAQTRLYAEEKARITGVPIASNIPPLHSRTGPAGPHPPPSGGPSSAYPIGGAPGPQVNGVPNSHPPTPSGAPPQTQMPQGPHPGGPQPPHFNNGMVQQRGVNGAQPPLPLNGNPQQQQQQQRPMGAPNLPFQSPTMVSQSPNHGPGMQHGPQGQPPGGMQPPPMGNLGGPSPLMASMNRGGHMLPPNGAPQQPGMMMGAAPMPGGTPTQQFQPLHNAARPPSRSNTPQMQGNVFQHSPGMANRQLVATEAQINQQFAALLRIPSEVNQLKAEIGLPDKDSNSLPTADKRRIVQHWQQTRRPANAVAGPSNPGILPNQPQRGPHQPMQRGKRSSTSPGEEHDNLPRTESSPPDRKRPRRSPLETSSIPKSAYPQTPQQVPTMPPQHGAQGQPPQGHPPGGIQHQPGTGGMPPNMMMMGGGRPMQGGPMGGQMIPNGHIPPPAMNMQGPPPHGQMQAGGMNPQNQMGHQLTMMMPNQMGGQNYRVPLHQAHQVHNTPMVMQPPNAGSPAGPDPSFNASGQAPPGGIQPGGPQFNPNRLSMGPKPGGMQPHGSAGAPGSAMMPPPPSPANGGKDVGKDGKPHPDGSPAGAGQPPHPSPQQNPNLPQQQQGGPPPPGAPSNQQQQPPQQQQGNPGPPPSQAPVGGPGAASPPMMGNAGAGNAVGGLGASLNGLGDMNMFSNDFSMVGFGDTGFDGALDFERDFGEWFQDESSAMVMGDGMK